jgi:hypothetical protein
MNKWKVAIVLLASAGAWGQQKASVQIALDPVQAKYPGNEHAKPCGPSNHDGVCVDDSLPHVTNRLYIQKDHCEQREGVRCTRDQQYFAPINKPVFEETAQVPLPGTNGAGDKDLRAVLPLECDKYQHEQHTPEHCANTCPPDGTICTTGCLGVPAEDKCVDDIHFVTEQEWQDLNFKIGVLSEYSLRLEKRLKVIKQHRP